MDSSQQPFAAPRPPEGALKPFPWTGLTLFLVVTALLGVAAVPRISLSPEELAGDRMAIACTQAAAEFRAAIGEYQMDHGQVPGSVPSHAGRLMEGPASIMWFERQLTMSSNEQGRTAPQETVEHPYGPYLPGLPANPINGLTSVQIVTAGAPSPANPDGETGWIYDPRDGEIWINSAGHVFGTDVRYFDL